jgi:nucleotide-binding universal stress UspA family protein
MAAMTHIAVGVDGSDASLAALDWAIDEALLRSGSILAVHSWQYVVFGTSGLEPYLPERKPLEDHAAGLLAASVSSVVDRRDDLGDLHIDQRTIEGAAGSVLVDVGRECDMLVIGARGHSALSGLLGSVSTHCAHHSVVPTVIVPFERH